MKQIANQIVNSNYLIFTEIKEIMKKVDNLLDQNKNELLIGNVSDRLIKRQQDIFLHLMNAKNAKIEKGEDQERES